MIELGDHVLEAVGSKIAAAYGEPCFTTQDCVGGQCLSGLCKLPEGSACMADVECVTAFCNNKTCTTCMDPFQCASMSCLVPGPGMAGSCGLPSGAYCTGNGQCAGTLCSGTPPKCQ